MAAKPVAPTADENAARGVAAVALAVITADRVVTKEERRAFHARLTALRVFQKLGSRGVETIVDDTVALERQQGTNGLLKLAVNIPTDLRLPAFALAADLAFADRALEGREVKVLEQVRQALAINDTDAVRVRDVTVMKWRL